jgi:hypothetical protein
MSIRNIKILVRQIQGPSGVDGKSLLNGTIDPTSLDGTDGDFWINTTSWKIFGPKTVGVWPVGVQLTAP